MILRSNLHEAAPRPRAAGPTAALVPGRGASGQQQPVLGRCPHQVVLPPAQVARQEGRIILTSGLPYHTVRTPPRACPLHPQQLWHPGWAEGKLVGPERGGRGQGGRGGSGLSADLSAAPVPGRGWALPLGGLQPQGPAAGQGRAPTLQRARHPRRCLQPLPGESRPGRPWAGSPGRGLDTEATCLGASAHLSCRHCVVFSSSAHLTPTPQPRARQWPAGACGQGSCSDAMISIRPGTVLRRAASRASGGREGSLEVLSGWIHPTSGGRGEEIPGGAGSWVETREGSGWAPCADSPALPPGPRSAEPLPALGVVWLRGVQPFSRSCGLGRGSWCRTFWNPGPHEEGPAAPASGWLRQQPLRPPLRV